MRALAVVVLSVLLAGFVNADTPPYADPKYIFFYGLSRGGMMTFLALARGVTVNAAAVVGGIYDLQGLLESTKQRMPGVAKRGDAADS